MCPVGGDDASHTHLWSTFEKAFANDRVGLGDLVEATSDGQDAVVDSLYNLADTRLYACLVSQVGNILSRLANDYARFFRGNNRTKGHLRLCVFFISARALFSISIASIKTHTIHRVSETAKVRFSTGVGGHFGSKADLIDAEMGGEGEESSGFGRVLST